jgi:hypothetical protein
VLSGVVHGQNLDDSNRCNAGLRFSPLLTINLSAGPPPKAAFSRPFLRAFRPPPKACGAQQQAHS